MATTAGYASTPLAKKLGVKEDFSIRLINQPKNYLQLFTDWPENVKSSKDKEVKKDFIHFFVTEAELLFLELPLLKNEIKEAGMIWVSWPKKASKMKTDITEDVIRNFALEIGLVDIKVCAVDEIWSGLKLVIPLAKRNN